MILLTHVCDRCRKAVTEEIVLEGGVTNLVRLPHGWKDDICEECQHTLKVLERLESDG